ncbi:Mg-chelatase subunit ChlD [Thiorhodovibrio frisius]|uniref:Mg-chelatase subunit ChlD n=2 Tax=Thiorhodovibrio frisius TaxID=631362 RepID=H8Z4C2_9GAMM|nr:Mg-chelatase subunit ChlD [Thiorhodovibrio frisius]WPL20916.1 VWFA-related Acidobacterial domain protein [Thiorhodovibrio frisius]
MGAQATFAQGAGYGFAAPGSYGLKIYRSDYSLYPFVQVYFRTFDAQMQPLVNLNERNIGVMVKGRTYDPMKRQYGVQSIRQREEATRSVLIIDASQSMAGAPFEETLRAAIRYIESKRPQDEVAVLAIRDTKEGYEVVSQFERDERALARRIADIRADGMKTRLYDAVGAALQMCGMASQGSVIDSANYVVSCSVVVFSDGKDEGSSVSRDELMTRISGMSIPVPIYSLAYSRIEPTYFKNLEALSKNSFGIYYLVGETTNRMQQVVEQIQNILQSDYVLTFRSYVPVDGEKHNLKLGVEYPSGSGKYVYDDTTFEAIQPPPIPAIDTAITSLNQKIPALPDGNPYWERPTTPVGTAE